MFDLEMQMGKAGESRQADLTQSFAGHNMGGGFYWWVDTPKSRAEAIAEGQRDAPYYGNVIVVACVLKVPATTLPNDITDLLDADLVFEQGNVGKILFKSFTEESA